MPVSFEAAHDEAARLLEQRGQLLNGHLLRVVEGDKELFRQVRDALIQGGRAHDRAGIALALNEFKVQPAQNHDVIDSDGKSASAPSSMDDSAELDVDWWLMATGQILGPFTLGTLRQMQQRGEICPSDVVRRGAKGPWIQQSEVLRHATRQTRNPSDSLSTDDDSASQRDTPPFTSATASLGTSVHPPKKRSDIEPDEVSTSHKAVPSQPYLPPPKMWSLDDDARPSFVRRTFHSIAMIFGGPRRLMQLMALTCLIAVFLYWWKQPPPPATVYREFQECFATLQKMRERRTGRTDWGPTVNRFRPRVQGIVSRLQSKSSPAEKELYQAGHYGLIPLLAVPADPTNAERVFEKHMSAARQLIEPQDRSP